MQSMPMQGGCGDDSYSNNSHSQSFHFHAVAKPQLLHTLDHYVNVIPPHTSTFRIADFGCACGRNALDYADFIVAQLQEMYSSVAGTGPGGRSATVQLPEVQYFFSDLPSNDFNNLFHTLGVLRSMPPLPGQAGFAEFYAAGVPGSFYSRLFPEGSLHLAITSYSLHWLSQVPRTVMDKKSPAWNGGHVWIHGERPAVCHAYAEQFQVDMRNFLRYRAKELAKGGIMFLLSLCRVEEQPKGSYYGECNDAWSGYFDSTWEEMVHEGLVSAEERDTFNVPQYNFSRGEFEKAVKEVPELELVEIEVMEGRSTLPAEELPRLLADPEAFGRYWVGFIMSLIKPLVAVHIGEERAAELFKRLQRLATEKAHLKKKFARDLVVAVLRRTEF